MRRGEIWMVNLNPTKGSEQAGIRPVIIYQTDIINNFTSTFLSIPLTTNLRRAALPTCVLIAEGEGGLLTDSVALCHQMRAIDKSRFQRRLGMVKPQTLNDLEHVVKFTLGMSEHDILTTR